MISSQFADIFKHNALNNGILPIEVSNEDLEAILTYSAEKPEGEFHVDVEEQTLSIPELDFDVQFALDPFKKHCIIQGIDETQYLINLREEIANYERQRITA